MISSHHVTVEIFHMQLVIICRTMKGISGLILIRSLSVRKRFEQAYRVPVTACVRA